MEEPPYNSEYSSALFVGENYQKKGGEGEMINLKPCPFCGEEVTPIWFTENGEYRYEGLLGEEISYIKCYECDAEIYISNPNGDEAIIEQWNNRV